MSLLGKLLVGLGMDTKGLDVGTKKAKRKLSFFQRQTKSISKGITRSLGTIGAGFAIGSVIADAGRKVVEFDQKLANLASITGRSRSEIGSLAENAKAVGAVSAFSASQVLDLQTELAKLGNSESQIISMTKSVGDFSIAVGSTTSEAAVLAGGALKSFGRDASETEKTVSTLAVATTKSALDFSKLSTAIPIVGTAANEFGFSLEKTTALLGVLADRNVDASTSSTALRNIFLELKKKGLTYDEAMERINNSTDSLNEANKLFGKRGAVVATILAKTRTQADELEKSITGVDGALKKMTDERLDTLTGKMTLLGSAWSTFVHEVASGDGAISTMFKNTADTATGLLNVFTEFAKGNVSAEKGLLLLYGDDETRANVKADLTAIRKEQSLINKGILDSTGRRTNRASGFAAAGVGQSKSTDDTEITKLTTLLDGVNKELDTTKKKETVVLSLSDKIKTLKDEITQLSEAYIEGGSSDQNIITSITSKQSEIDALNQKLSKSISLVNQLKRGDQTISGPASIGSIGLPSSISSETSGQPPTLQEGFLEKAKRDTDALATSNNTLADSYNAMASAMASSLSSGANSFEEFGQTMLGTIQKTIGGLIKLFIAKALAGLAATGPLGLIAAGGIASLAEGIFNTAINSAKVPALASGGVIKKPTYALLGEYSGASSNPEIATPENLLRNILSDELRNVGNTRGTSELFSYTKGSDIYHSTREFDYRMSRTG